MVGRHQLPVHDPPAQHPQQQPHETVLAFLPPTVTATAHGPRNRGRRGRSAGAGPDSPARRVPAGLPRAGPLAVPGARRQHRAPKGSQCPRSRCHRDLGRILNHAHGDGGNGRNEPERDRCRERPRPAPHDEASIDASKGTGSSAPVRCARMTGTMTASVISGSAPSARSPIRRKPTPGRRPRARSPQTTDRHGCDDGERERKDRNSRPSQSA